MFDDVSRLTKLGNKKKYVRYSNPTTALLETFPNQYPERNYLVEYVFHEFTSCCPKTGAPDFAVMTVRYIPDKFCIETKSLKEYYMAYRNEGCFMETLTNKILNDLVQVCNPRRMEVIACFNPRGGTDINIKAEYVQSGFKE
ncbi:MAG: preQ(1) synthase [Candidatus Pacebacteria bacterium]|nr:preQ(1) synthase [Candidatus Paceibacterota bacterium]